MSKSLNEFSDNQSESNEQLPSREELIAALAKTATSPNILAANTIDPDQHTGK